MQKTAVCYRPARNGMENRRYSIKTLLVMKLTVLLLTVAILQVQAKGISQEISFSGKNVSLEQLFKEVKKQTGYSVFYNTGLLKTSRPIDVSVNKMSLTSFLDLCLQNQALSYYLERKTVIILQKNETSPSLTIPGSFAFLPITGTITGTDGKPLQGINIQVKGTPAGTVSDGDGRFSINVAEGSTLIISGIGFQQTEVKIGTNTSLNIVLQQKTTDLDTAAVTVSTGYQRIARERSAGSFSKPDMSIVQARSTSMNIMQRLDGLVPGLAINNAPGTETYQIRGLTSINGTSSPLFVLDGVVLDNGSIGSVNPNDVADITVLKDATAASIWGSNAANGVIVITTKKGSATGKIKMDYDGFVNFQGRPEFDYLPSLDNKQFIQAAKEVFNSTLNTYASVTKFVPSTWKPLAAHEIILYNLDNKLITQERASAQLDSLASIDNRQQINDLFYRNMMLTNHTLSLSGGFGKYSFYGSAAYTGNRNSSPGNSNTVAKVNLRQDFRFSNNLQVYLITDLNNTNAASKRSVSPTTMFLPYVTFRDNGVNNSMSWLYFPEAERIGFETKSKKSLDYNPLDEWNRGYNKSNGLLARINTGIDIKLMKGLKFQGVYGVIKGTSKTRSFDSDESFTFRRELVQFTQPATGPTTKPTYLLPEFGGIYSVDNSTQTSWNVRNQLTFDDAFNGRMHQVTAIVGQEIRKREFASTRSIVRGYDEQLLTSAYVDYKTLAGTGVAGAVLPKGTGNNKLDELNFVASEEDVRFRSYYANLGYTFNSKYTFNSSGRIDESNLFGKDKSAQNKPVWSVGASWLMSSEKFMDNIDWIDRLSVRTTYGITGNAPIPGRAASFDIFSAQTSAIFPAGRALVLSTPGNKSLTWESTKTINIGLDFGVWKRLSGSIEFYVKNTDNLIGDLQVNSFTGFSAIEGNQGALRNEGVELSLNSLNISSRNFTWRTMLNLGYNKNKVTDLYSKTAITTGSARVDQRFVEGYSAYSLFAYQYAGLDTKGAPQVRLNDGTVSIDRNIAKPEDIVYKGSFQPKWTGGLGNYLTYKDFGLQINVVYNLGFVMRRDVNRFYSGGRLVPDVGSLTTGNVHAEFANRWKKAKDELITDIPAYVDSIKTDTRELNYYYLADRNVLDASYIKLRDITFSYNLPKALVNSIKAEGISLRFQLSNVMLWKANDYGIDPEFQSASSGVRNMPFNQKAFTVGAHVTF